MWQNPTPEDHGFLFYKRESTLYEVNSIKSNSFSRQTDFRLKNKFLCINTNMKSSPPQPLSLLSQSTREDHDVDNF